MSNLARNNRSGSSHDGLGEKHPFAAGIVLTRLSASDEITGGGKPGQARRIGRRFFDATADLLASRSCTEQGPSLGIVALKIDDRICGSLAAFAVFLDVGCANDL